MNESISKGSEKQHHQLISICLFIAVMAIMVSAASASAADYQCTTSLDAGQDVHINPLWLAGIAILIIGGLVVCGIVLIPGA